jgi:anti-sigma B factor antagonist
MSIDEAGGGPSSAADDAGAARSKASVSVSVHASGVWTIVAIAGEMDLLTVPLIRELVSADARHVMFELRQVTFMDGRGLDLLLRSQRGALRAGGCVRLVAPSRQVRRLLMLTGSNREFTTFASVDEATSVPAPGLAAVAAPRRALEAPYARGRGCRKGRTARSRWTECPWLRRLWHASGTLLRGCRSLTVCSPRAPVNQLAAELHGGLHASNLRWEETRRRHDLN